MATMHRDMRVAGDHRFFLVASFVMAATIALGFSMQLAMGRSSFSVPIMLHVHALVFFGWTALYVTQTALAATGSRALHKRLGWVGAFWAATVVMLGLYTTAMMVRRGASPFFFLPAYFLVMNSLTVLAFGGLIATGLALRRHTAWHRRLMFCGMAMLTGPAFGRLLPLPLMIPWAAWGVFAAVMLFPVAGVIADLRRNRRVHPAWWWGMTAMAGTQVAMDLLTYSAVGTWLYGAVTAGSAGANVAPLTFPAPPF